MTQFADNVKAAQITIKCSQEKDMNMLQEVNQKYVNLQNSVLSSKQAMIVIISHLNQYIKGEISTSKLFGYKRLNQNKKHSFEWTETESRQFRQFVVNAYAKLSEIVNKEECHRDEIVSLGESLHFCRSYICSVAECMENSNIQKCLNEYLNALNILQYEKGTFIERLVNVMMNHFDIPNGKAWEIFECAEKGLIRAVEKYNPQMEINPQIGKRASFESFAAIDIKDAIRKKINTYHKHGQNISIEDAFVLEDKGLRPDEYLEKKDIHHYFSEDKIMNMSYLKNKDKLVLLLYFGYIPKTSYSVADICHRLDISVDIDELCFEDDNDDVFTYDEIGDILHVSKQSAQQRMKQTIKILSEHYKGHFAA